MEILSFERLVDGLKCGGEARRAGDGPAGQHVELILRLVVVVFFF